MPHHSDNVERFNDIANDWDADPMRVYAGQKIGRAIRAALALQGTENALEFGAGTGLASLLVAPKVARLTALDGSAGMLAVLRDKAARKQLANLTVLEGQVPDDLPPGPFDCIYSAMTTHHIEDVPALLRELFARLKPSGRLALADLDKEDGNFHGQDSKGVAHLGFERDQFQTWLEAAGFEQVSFSTAYTIQREMDDGDTRPFPVFLAVADRPAT